MNELYYEPHLERWRRQFGYGASGVSTSQSSLDYLEEQAKHEHALTVWDPLFQLAAHTTLEVPSQLMSRDARIYLQYGVGRRVSDMFEVYRAVVLTAYDGRKEPLRHEEQQVFSRNLNTLYINLRGILDNLAFCLMYERQPDLRSTLRDMEIGLFVPKYRSNLTAFAEIETRIKLHDDWNREIKSRRDPAAHRIPLYLPPSQVTEQEAERARQILSVQHEKVLAGEFDEANRLFEQATRIGRFFPAFMHHPDEPPIPIYPTIPNDVAHMIEIARTVTDNLLSTRKK